jgi:cell division inhibitor SepF
MASMWRRAMLYLGLGPDEEYDDYDAPDDHQYQQQPAPHAAAPQPAVTMAPPGPAAPPGPPGPPRPAPAEMAEAPAVRPLVREPEPAITMRPRPSVVRPIQASASAKPHVISPTSFNEAQEVADKFKGNQPVIVNLQGVERDLSRRLIDFASGLCYGLGGQMDKVAHQVYLLTPTNVEVSAEEKRRLQERGLYDS